MHGRIKYICFKGSLLLLTLAFFNNSCAQDADVPVESGEGFLNRQHKPSELMDVIGLEEGMVIADIGAGRGRMTVFFASRVGEGGMVLANEINSGALEHLEKRCKRNSINNVKTILGTVSDPKLPAGKADIIFMVSTYHHLDKPVELMRNARSGLKPGGRLIIVERDPVKTGQSNSENTSQEQVTRQMTQAGYTLLDINTEFLERDNIYFFGIN